jgi:hypothetical protein
MRTNEECRRFRVLAIQFAKNIADPVDMNVQTDLPHLVNEKLPAAQLFNGKDQPCHRAVIADADT